MNKRNKILRNLFLIALTCISISCAAQVTVSGPTCVVPGTTYEYTISGSWDSVSIMQVCITGGYVPDSLVQGMCTPQGAPLSAILVIWDSAMSGGAITVSSSLGNVSLAVSITTPLIAGFIDSVSGQQAIGYDSVPSTIYCSADSGGSCSPSYSYCWQQSTDAVNWVNVPDSANQNLNFSEPITTTTFYRRKSVEVSSGTIGYSGLAVVRVSAQMPVTDSTMTDSTSTGKIKLKKEKNVIAASYKNYYPKGFDGEKLFFSQSKVIRKKYYPAQNL